MITIYEQKTCRGCEGYDNSRTDESLLKVNAIACKTRSTVVPETSAEGCQKYVPRELKEIAQGGSR